MFKEASIFKFSLEDSNVIGEEHLEAARFQPCGPSQDLSFGFTPPRGTPHDPLVEVVHGEVILEVAIETKSVPGDLVKREMKALVEKIENVEGRKPGRKECRQLSEEVRFDLLKNAFPKHKRVKVWIDKRNSRIIIGSSSSSVIDTVVTLMIKAIPGLSMSLLNTQVSPQASMTSWLATPGDDALDCENFGIGRFVELKSGDEMKSVVKFDRHHLAADEMRKHIGEGKLPIKLGMEWSDRVSFVLTEGSVIKKIEFLDGALENYDRDEAGGFDADVVIETSELREMIDDLIAAMGGELA